jgi:hypothetical protein
LEGDHDIYYIGWQQRIEREVVGFKLRRGMSLGDNVFLGSNRGDTTITLCAYAEG